MRLLLVEDTEDVAEAIVASFQRRGDAIDSVGTVEDARDTLAVNDYDVVILDINLPDGPGTEVLRDLRRQRRATPVLMLTARMAVQDRVDALDIGADDYLVKPFDLAELSARIGSVSRRYAGQPNPRIAFGPFEVDLVGRAIRGPQGAVDLSQREWAIFEALLRSPGVVLTKSRLEDQLYTFDAEVESNTIEVYISRLRRKLGRDSIETLRGLGYRLGRP